MPLNKITKVGQEATQIVLTDSCMLNTDKFVNDSTHKKYTAIDGFHPSEIT